MPAPPRLETMRALVDLGATLRRENRRAEAREPLERAADIARRGGAVALSERARVELAAPGQSNREIAQALFVTPKTVEYHLRNTYRKLEIQTRRELAEALSV